LDKAEVKSRGMPLLPSALCPVQLQRPNGKARVRLIFVNRFFYPDHSATSQMLSDLAFALANEGRSVSVITSRQLYDEPTGNALAARETVKSVSVYRVWASRFGRTKLLGRTIDYLTFYISAGWRLWRLTHAGDVVIAKTDPPMLSLVAGPVCWLRVAHLVNWLQDIFPEVAEELGFRGGAARAAFAVLRRLRNWSLSQAASNVVVGERMAARLSALNIEKERIRIIANWADDNIAPVRSAANPLRASWALQDRFVIGYSGNLGRAHETNTLLHAICELEGHGAPIEWLFIGGGVLYRKLEEEIERGHLKSVQFRPYQPREHLAESLSAADVHLVSLKPELEGLIVPSKFYGIAAAGRPTIFIGDRDGEIARLIARHDCGRTVAMGDGAALTQTILELAGDLANCRRMGERARRAFEAEFSKSIAVTKWRSLLEGLVGSAPVTYSALAIAEDASASAKNAR
jgi:colanic acid biosynthesis glycosyl transferase WcaI